MASKKSQKKEFRKSKVAAKKYGTKVTSEKETRRIRTNARKSSAVKVKKARKDGHEV